MKSLGQKLNSLTSSSRQSSNLRLDTSVSSDTTGGITGNEITRKIEDGFDQLFITIPTLSLKLVEIIEKQIPKMREEAEKNPDSFRIKLQTIDMNRFPVGAPLVSPEEADIPIDMLDRVAHTCLKHLYKKNHVCADGNHFLRDVDLLPYPILEVEKRMEPLLESCKKIYDELLKNMIKVETAIHFLYPKRQDTETHLGLSVLDSVMRNTHIQQWNVQSIYEKRVAHFQDAINNPHFEFNELALYEFYLKVLNTIDSELWVTLNKTAYVHSTLVKNMESILSIHEMQFNQTAHQESVSHFYS